MEWEVGVSRSDLLYLECINNKVVPYSTENYMEYPVIKHNGKEHSKNNLYICISLCYIAIINTTL